MRNLLNAAFSRYMHDYFTLLTLIGAAVLGCLSVLTSISVSNEFELKRTWFIAILLLCAFLTSLAVGREFHGNTIRNKLIVGHSKVKVYLAEMAASLTLSAASFLLCALPIFLTTGEFRRDLALSDVLQGYVVLLFVYLFFTALTVTASFLTGSRVASVIAVCVAMLMMYGLSDWQEDVIYRSSEDFRFQTMTRVEYDENDEPYVVEFEVQRIEYIDMSDTERNALIFANHCNTFSSLYHFVTVNNTHPTTGGGVGLMDPAQWKNVRDDMLHALHWDIAAQCIVMVLLTAAGAYLFRRKDLK